MYKTIQMLAFVMLLSVRGETPTLNHQVITRTLMESLRDQLLGRVPENTEVVTEVSEATEARPHSLLSPAVSRAGHRDIGENSVMDSLFDLGVSTLKRQEARDQEEEAFVNTIVELGMSAKAPTSLKPSGDGDQVTSPLLLFLEGLREDAWQQLRWMVLNFTEVLSRENKTQELEHMLPLNLIHKALEFGDKVNFLHILSGKVDPGLTEYLTSPLKPLLKSETDGSKLDKGASPFVMRLMRNAALETMRKFARYVMNVMSHYITDSVLEDYRRQLVTVFPTAAVGLDLILNLPLMSPENLEGRSLVSRQGYGTYTNGYGGYGSGAGHSYGTGYDSYGNVNKAGYGGYGIDNGAGYSSYGTSSAYNYGVYIDPYLVLGSLGAAALLSLLAFKVIRSLDATARIGREVIRRNNDIPNIVTSVYTILENAEEKYDHKNSSSSTPDNSDDSYMSKRSLAVDDLAQGLNSLWMEHKNDSGCVRCLLFRSTVQHTRNLDDPAMDLTLASVAHLLGAERSGQLLDEVTDLILEGRPVTCEREANTCVLK